MIFGLTFFLLAVPAVLLNSVSKGGFGGAFGGIAVPLMAMAIAPPQAAAIMLPLLCAADVVGMRRYFGAWDRQNLVIMLTGGGLGVLLGTLSFGQLSINTLRLLVGLIAILFSLYYFLAHRLQQAPQPASWSRGILWSALSGYTSFVAHAGGPPAMSYLLPKRLDKMVYVATLNSFFMCLNFVKLVPYAMLGQFSRDTLSASLMLLPLVPVGVSIGFWLQGRINNLWFYRIAQICLLASGIQLVAMSLP